MRHFFTLFTCLLLVTCSPAAHSSQSELETFLQRYFSTWSAQDMTGYADCFHTTARISFVGHDGQCSSQGLTDFIHGQTLGHQRSPTPMKEVPTDMKISGDDRVAQAAVRWKLTKGSETVTGTDYFTLVKTASGWKIASLVFYND
ncbi:Putative lumazine-binding [Prosthecobacter debontii]|uniref:Putative lumazine-binding n=1 Tax=Prosthecobacter debontii TaxID=48467 RepID=A0A1T4Z3H0_9BACT|nr:nuclear transport factor 2 family protein [Prosthecobacter debontii]SKB08599.1 Putative lumazine-binding [Prosthecobacter debontii]